MHRLVPTTFLERTARRFRLLGEPSRLAILNNLNVAGEMSVQEIVDATGQLQANVSKHLGLLAREGLVARRAEGTRAFYRIADTTISALCLLVCGQIREMEDA